MIWSRKRNLATQRSPKPATLATMTSSVESEKLSAIGHEQGGQRQAGAGEHPEREDLAPEAHLAVDVPHPALVEEEHRDGADHHGDHVRPGGVEVEQPDGDRQLELREHHAEHRHHRVADGERAAPAGDAVEHGGTETCSRDRSLRGPTLSRPNSSAAQSTRALAWATRPSQRALSFGVRSKVWRSQSTMPKRGP